MLTREQFQRALPKQMAKSVSTDLIEKINHTLTEDGGCEELRDNILGFANVLREGKFKMTSYIDAVRYVSFKLLGDNNITAFTKTFPDRYQRYLAEGVSQKDIASYVTAYNKNKLVNLIYEQTLVPTHVLNADVHQKAINKLASLMGDETVHPREQVAAASSLLQHLKPPEVKKVELEIGNRSDSIISELEEKTAMLAAKQLELIEAGVTSAKSAAHQTLIIEGTCDVED